MTSINKLSFKEFEPTKITVTEIQEPKKKDGKEPTQLTAFINYNGGRLELQTPWITLEQGGVPRLDDYNPTDKKRCCIKLPLNTAQNNEIATFYNKFLEVDKIIGSEESKTKLFGKKSSKYKYLNSVKVQDADDDEASTKLPKLNCRFAAEFGKDNKDTVTSITTKVFVTTLKEDGKVLSREEQSPTNINELANIVRFRSKVRLIIQPARLWASKTPAAGADKMTYGVIWQVKGIEVQPSLGGASTNSNADFIDDSDEDEKPQPKSTEQARTQTLLTHLTKKSTNHSDDEDEEDDKPMAKSKDSDEEEEEEEEPEPVPEPPKKSKGKAPVEKKKGK